MRGNAFARRLFGRVNIKKLGDRYRVSIYNQSYNIVVQPEHMELFSTMYAQMLDAANS